MAKQKTFWGKVMGEISALASKAVEGRFFSTGSAVETYTLNSRKVDYKLARSLYDNEHEEYKLGAGFAAPIINTKVGFMGVPTFVSADDEAQADLESFVRKNRSKITDTLLQSLRDGDAYVWITVEETHDKELYPEAPTRLRYNVIPPERVQIMLHPITSDVMVYKITTPMDWEDEGGNQKKCTITQFVDAHKVVTHIDGDTPPDIEPGEEATELGFIPIVHFKNKGQSYKYGQSELEPIEPFLKAYHDVMLHAMQGSKMHSTPKLKIKTESVEAFLENNLSDQELKDLQEGRRASVSLDGKELLILEGEDDASFIEVTSAIGDATTLLKFLFYCIVDTSETPEFVFGVHTPSSQASVTEQMPVLVRTIEAKRDHFNDAFDRLARIVLALSSNAQNKAYETYETQITWDKIDPRNANQISEELLNTVNALSVGLSAQIISDKSAIDYLAQRIDTMLPYEVEGGEGEKERIQKYTMNKYRMPDSDDLQKELERLKKELGEAG